jgi:hypothetical protein
VNAAVINKFPGPAHYGQSQARSYDESSVTATMIEVLDCLRGPESMKKC